MSRVIATRTVAFGVVAAVALAAAAPSGAAVATADPGVSSNQIVIGTTTPLTGPASPGYKDVAPAAQAYFNYVNATGGINGRKIKYVVKDDQYNPAKTKSATSELILRDKVFAIFGALGTPTHSAVVADINRRGIPDVFVNTGSSNFDNPSKYPTTFPYFPSYVVESKVMAYYIQSQVDLNEKKRCLFYQDGEFGENAEKGFNAAGMKFATTVSYFSGQQVAPFTSQITKMKSEGCELVVFFGVTSATAQMLGTAATRRLPAHLDDHLGRLRSVGARRHAGLQHERAAQRHLLAELPRPDPGHEQRLREADEGHRRRRQAAVELLHVLRHQHGVRAVAGAQGRRSEPDPQGAHQRAADEGLDLPLGSRRADGHQRQVPPGPDGLLHGPVRRLGPAGAQDQLHHDRQQRLVGNGPRRPRTVRVPPLPSCCRR